MKQLLLALICALFASTAFGVDTFELPWVNNAVTDLKYKSADHPNGVFVVEAYFLGCPYCNDNAPNVNALADKYRKEPRVQVLDVSRDCRASDYRTWISRHKPNHPVLNDCSKKLIGQLGTRYYPSVYVIDCHGDVVYDHVGVWNGEVKREIDQVISGLLRETCE